jgi:hypothetical protein
MQFASTKTIASLKLIIPCKIFGTGYFNSLISISKECSRASYFHHNNVTMEDSPHTHGVTRKTSPGYTEAQWESIKEIVRQRYFEENKTLSNVVDILSKDYGFTLS